MSTETVAPETPVVEATPLDQLDFESYKKARNEGVTEVPAEAPKEPQVEQAETPEAEAEPEPSSEPEAEQPKGEKRKGGFQKKIDRLTKEKREAQDERNELRDRLAAIEQRLAPKAETEAQRPAGKPARANFTSDADYIDAATAWNVEQTLARKEAESARLAEEQSRKQVFDSYNEQAREFETTHEDWHEVVGRDDIHIPTAVQLSIIEMENGPAVAYHLGKNPELCQKLMEMTPLRAVLEVGKIEASLAPRSETPARSTDGKFVSRAAAPITPVGTTGTKSSVPIDKLGFEEYKKARAAGRTN